MTHLDVAGRTKYSTFGRSKSILYGTGTEYRLSICFSGHLNKIWALKYIDKRLTQRLRDHYNVDYEFKKLCLMCSKVYFIAGRDKI